MYKIAILGCENSHANRFLDAIIKDKKFDNIEVIGVYSYDEAAAQKLNEDYGVYVMKNYDEFVGEVDGIVITARHGDNHYKYAKPYIKSGIPMFIDKPITVSEEDGIAFMKELKENGVRACGGSMCVFAPYVQELKKIVEEKTYGDIFGGFVRAPLDINSPHGGFFFYSQHLAQVMMEIFGYYPNSVNMYQNGKIYTGIVRYDDYDVSITYTDGNHHYAAGVSCENKIEGGEYPIDGGFEKEFREFYELLAGGEQQKPYDKMLAPVFVLNAMNRSIESGNEEIVNKFEI